MPYKTSHKAQSTLTSKGQITLPVVLRRRWDLKPGDRLDFTLEDDGRVVLRKWVRRSILDIGEILPPLPSLTEDEIGEAVARAAKDKGER
jgi:AbrB family looped-hinge helix DNA binding protein